MESSSHGYGWPPRMIMRIACAYTGRSRWALARAAREGSLPVAGRNGRTLVFERNALDAWMVGAPGVIQPLASAARTASARRDSIGSAAALGRLRELKEGAR